MRVAVLVLIEGLIIVLMTFTALVFRRYYQAWKVISRKGRMLPHHVVLVSASYYLLLIALASRQADWRAAIYVPALILGILAMISLLRAGD